ncbi:MAG: tetratricopeptide repeat protein [Candidatus Ozemobacteraceae bacterium]
MQNRTRTPFFIFLLLLGLLFPVIGFAGSFLDTSNRSTETGTAVSASETQTFTASPTELIPSNRSWFIVGGFVEFPWFVPVPHHTFFDFYVPGLPFPDFVVLSRNLSKWQPKTSYRSESIGRIHSIFFGLPLGLYNNLFIDPAGESVVSVGDDMFCGIFSHDLRHCFGWRSVSATHESVVQGYLHVPLKFQPLSARDLLKEGLAELGKHHYQLAAMLLRCAAEMGSGPAAYRLSLMFRNGEGVPQSASEADFWLKRAADLGYPRAAYDYAIRLIFGSDPRNLDLGIDYLRKAAQGRFASAMVTLGEILINGRIDGNQSIKADLEEARMWLLQAAGLGRVDAKFLLGQAYLHGTFGQVDEKEARKWFQEAAIGGHVEAAFLYARLLLNGSVGLRDFVEAARWFRFAADKGHLEAQYETARMYRYGLGVAPDEDEAERWYKKVALRGHAHAAYELAGLLDGRGRLSEAIIFYRQAAEAGIPEAEFAYGKLFFEGRGVPQNFSETARWYLRSAEHGFSPAQHAYGWMQLYGIGTSMNLPRAIVWLQKAVHHGYAFAHYDLVVARFLGLLLWPEYPEMIRFYGLAMFGGFYNPANFFLNFGFFQAPGLFSSWSPWASYESYGLFYFLSERPGFLVTRLFGSIFRSTFLPFPIVGLDW